MRDLRPWTHAALYGALWGALEATVGTAIHLGRVPFRGEIMGLIGLVCLVCLRRLQPRTGVVLVAGLTAIFLKVFTLGGLYPGPLVGIATQALAVELGFLVARGPWAAALGGVIALGTNPIQRVDHGVDRRRKRSGNRGASGGRRDRWGGCEVGSGRFCRVCRIRRRAWGRLRLAACRSSRAPTRWWVVNPVLALVLAVAVGASFSSKIEVVAAAAVVACSVAWVVDRSAFRRVLRASLVLAAVFAAAAATAAVAWVSGLERGLMIGGTILLRLVALGTTAAVVARSVDAEMILRMTARFGMERLGLVFGLALNALPHLSETASIVWAAHRVRSGGRVEALRRFPALAEVLLAHTGRVADQAAAAAALRGHTALGRSAAPLAVTTRVLVVTGPPGSGKTPLAASVAEELIARGVPVAGFCQPAILEDGEKVGFSLRDLVSGETAELARRVAPGAGAFGTSFRFADEGFELARRALSEIPSSAVLILDELGPVELRGSGHWPAVARALEGTDLAGLVVVVRRTLVPALVEALDAADVVIFDLEEVEDDPVKVIVEAVGGCQEKQS